MSDQLLVIAPRDNLLKEREYIYRYVLEESLSLPISIIWSSETTSSIAIRRRQGQGEVRLPDEFFERTRTTWLGSFERPQFPLPVWRLPAELAAVTTDPSLPVVFGREEVVGEYFVRNGHDGSLGVDVFGAAFFFLTRYEEVVAEDRDEHDRFAASSSLAWNADLLDRPIVDEYILLLGECLRMIFGLEPRSNRQYQVTVTHDVDRPFGLSEQAGIKRLRPVVGAVLREWDFDLAIRRLKTCLKRGDEGRRSDPAFTFSFLLEESEKRGLRSCFNFMTANTAGQIDVSYSMDDPLIRNLIAEIVERGHEVGIHPSYNTYRDPEQLYIETELLRRILDQLGGSTEIGGRQHYLRWSATETWGAYENAGLLYDSTLGFADKIGFRCGTSWDYPVYDLYNRRKLKLREVPLIVMECSAFARKYMGMTHSAGIDSIAVLASRCRKVQGNLVLLWHNNYIASQREKAVYLDVLDRCLGT